MTGAISSTGNVTAPYFIGNVCGNIAGNIVVPGSNTQVIYNNNGNAGASAGLTFNCTSNAMTVAGNITSGNLATGTIISGNIIPSATNTFSLGNINNQWANLWVYSNTIYIGNIPIGVSGNSITINGNPIVVANSSGTTCTPGNVSVIGNIDGGNLMSSGCASIAGNITTACSVIVGGVINVAATSGISICANAGTIVANTFCGLTQLCTRIVTVGSAGVYTNITRDGVNSPFGNLLLQSQNANIASVSTTGISVTGILSATGNLTTGGSLCASGNANVANLNSAGIISALGNIYAGNIISNAIFGNNNGVTITATGTNQNITLVPSGNGVVSVNTSRITNLVEPSASTDAATKNYVDTVAQGLNVHAAVQAGTPANLATITGGTVIYNNGANGVGATLTLSSALTVLDGYTLLNTNRVMVKNEANTATNGLYTWATGGTVLTRAVDFNTPTEIAGGDFFFVQFGTLYGNTSWVEVNTVTTVGTDPITFTQIGAAAAYTAGTGLTLNGTQFSISNTTVTTGSYGNTATVGTFTVNQQGQLTAAGSANLSQLVNGNSNVVVVANGNVSIGSTGNANVLLVTGTGVSVTGNVAAGNISVTGNSSAGNYSTVGNIAAGNLSVTGNSTAANYSTAGNVTSGNSTTGVLSATGNVTFTGARISIGNVANVKMTGGANGQILQTDGTGNLQFTNVTTSPAIHFDVASTANNQSFTDARLANYTSNTQIVLFRNGALVPPTAYTLSSTILTVNVQLFSNDNLDITPQPLLINTVANSPAAGANTQIQYNTNGSFGASSGLTFDGSTLASSNITTPGNLSVGGVINVASTFGNSIIATAGNVVANNFCALSAVNAVQYVSIGSAGVFTTITRYGMNSPYGNLIVEANNSNNMLLYSGGINVTGNLAVTGNLSAGNSSAGNYSTTGNVTSGNLSVTGNTAAATLSATGNVVFTGANVSLGNVANLTITGSNANGQVLTVANTANGAVTWSVLTVASYTSWTNIAVGDVFVGHTNAIAINFGATVVTNGITITILVYNSDQTQVGAAPIGTYKCMGGIANNSAPVSVALWQRIA